MAIVLTYAPWLAKPVGVGPCAACDTSRPWLSGCTPAPVLAAAVLAASLGSADSLGSGVSVGSAALSASAASLGSGDSLGSGEASAGLAWSAPVGTEAGRAARTAPADRPSTT